MNQIPALRSVSTESGDTTEAEPTETWGKQEGEQARVMMWAGLETSVSVISQRPGQPRSVVYRCLNRARKIDAIQAGSCKETSLNPLHHAFLHHGLRNKASAGNPLERNRPK